MAKLDLTQYGITGSTVIAHNPSYEYLFEEETKAGLEGKGLYSKCLASAFLRSVSSTAWRMTGAIKACSIGSNNNNFPWEHASKYTPPGL